MSAFGSPWLFELWVSFAWVELFSCVTKLPIFDILINIAWITTEPSFGDFFEEGQGNESYTEFFFSVEVDEDIAPEILCRAVKNLEINSQFLDEELICPDQRTDRFDIYATRVGPEDLEDCD